MRKKTKTQGVLCTEKGKDNTYAAFVKTEEVWSDARLDGIDEDEDRASTIMHCSFTRDPKDDDENGLQNGGESSAQVGRQSARKDGGKNGPKNDGRIGA